MGTFPRRRQRQKVYVEDLEPRVLLSTWTVTSRADDGSVGTLRYAVSNSSAGDTIEFAPSFSQVEIGPYMGVFGVPLEVSHDLTIEGPGASRLLLSGSAQNEVLKVDAGVTAAISGLTFTGGGTGNGFVGPANGNDIINSGNLTLSDCTVSGAVNGAGILNTGTLRVTGTTISGNENTAFGGGIDNMGSATVVESTLSGNSATDGGAIANQGTATLAIFDSTIASNSSNTNAGGIYTTGSCIVNNTIAWGNSIHDIDGAVTGSHNLIGSFVLGGLLNGQDGNIIGVGDARLAPLGDYGGPTQTMPPTAGSTAIDVGDNSLIPVGVTIDQRGFGRVYAGRVDIGASEYQPLLVNTTADGSLSSGQFSLRTAVNLANQSPGASRVNFDPAVFTSAMKHTITFVVGFLDIKQNLAIQGPGLEVLALDGNNFYQILQVESGVQAELAGLTISNAHTTGYTGAGVENLGTLTVSDCAFNSNSVEHDGGAIENAGTLVVRNCMFTGNRAQFDGAGIDNYKGMLTVLGSSFSGNSAGLGAAISNYHGTAMVMNCVID